jgi:hypothetical protein
VVCLELSDHCGASGEPVEYGRNSPRSRRSVLPRQTEVTDDGAFTVFIAARADYRRRD